MEPGPYYNIPFSEYLTIEALSSSQLKDFARSPLLYQWRLAHPSKDTPAKTLGRAIHAAILEPGKFAADYISYEGRRSGKVWTEFQEAHAGKNIIKADECLQCLDMYDATFKSSTARSILDRVTNCEVSLVAELDGILAKGRADALAEPGMIVDLKSTIDPRQAFERQAYSLGYHWQAAWYIDLMAELGRPDQTFVIIAIEKSPPFEVVVYEVDDRLLDIAREEMHPVIEQFKRCREEGVWPGYADQIVMLEPPSWVAKRHEEM